MPKFTVSITEPRELIFEIDALNVEDAESKAAVLPTTDAVKSIVHARIDAKATRKLEAHELAFKMQLDNIRRDYELIRDKQKLPSGEIVNDATAETIRANLITLYNAIASQSGIECEPLGEDGSVVTEHLGDGATIEFFKQKLGDPTKPEPEPTFDMDDATIWEEAAKKLGWVFDEDYKGWINPKNRKAGAIHGEWDAYTRDLTAEDACNEEGVETIPEAKMVMLGKWKND